MPPTNEQMTGRLREIVERINCLPHDETTAGALMILAVTGWVTVRGEGATPEAFVAEMGNCYARARLAIADHGEAEKAVKH